MSQLIKLLSHNSLIFFPLTSSEAVLIKDNSKVTTLEVYLKKPIIEPNTEPLNLKIQYNLLGKIVKVEEVPKLTIYVGNLKHSEYNGNTENVVSFGEDFKIDDNKNIVLTWNNI